MNKRLRSAEKDRSKSLQAYRLARKRHRGQGPAWADLRDKTTVALEIYADLVCDAGPLFRKVA